MANFVWGGGGVQMTPERIAAERKVAQALMEKGMDYSPVEHWSQGAARVAQAISGSLDYNRINKAEQANLAADRETIAGMLGQVRAPAVAPVAAPVAAVPAGAMALDTTGQPVAGADGGIMPAAQPNYRDAIASIESGGKYDILGPVTKTGDRAHGRYQVMGANIGPWTEQYLGRKMTPQEFLADPAAQDTVFDKRFGSYVAQTGSPQDAASMWFSGRPLAGNVSKDQLGTSVPTYVQKFTKALGPQVAQAAPVEDPAALPPNATPTQGYAIPGQPSQPAPTGLAAVNPRVIQALTSPYASPGAKKIAEIMLTSQMGENKATDEIREYNLYKQQGGKESFFDYKVGLKKAGAIQNNVQIDQKGETEFAKAVGKNQAERFDKIVQGATDAQGMVANIQSLRDLGSRITTGKTAELTAALGPYAEAVGVKIEGLDDLQAYKAIVSKLAPTMRVPGSGATSDFEMKVFLEALPGLGKTAGGNEIIAQTLDAVAQHKIAAGEIASKAMSGELTAREAEKALRALPDPLTLWKRSRGSAAPLGEKPAPNEWRDVAPGVRIREKK